MKKYKPKDEKQDVIDQLIAMGVKVTATNGIISSIECNESQLQDVKQITKKDFEEVE
jgi:hypothetical protein